MYDVIIIGGGPAGYTAGLYSARAGLKTVLIEKLAPGGQMGTTNEIDNYPGFDEGVNGFDLSIKMKNGAERFGCETLMDEAVSLSLEGPVKTVKTASGEYQAKTVILAMGASPKKLGLENEDALRGKGVSYCATCDGMFYRDKTVAVVGGGNTAVEDALYLSKICRKVILIHRRDRLRASKIYTDSLKNTPNVEIFWNRTVESLLGDSRLNGLAVKNKLTGQTQVIPCDGVFIAVGNIPETKLIQGHVALDENGYVIADETTKTSIEGVYAAGDLRKKPLRQIVTAVSDGAVAVKFAEEYINAL